MRVARYFPFGTLALVTLSALLLLTLDLGRFKATAESLISDALGRELTISGPLHVNVGRHLSLAANDLTLADAAWADSDAFVAVGSLQATVDLWSLFTKTVLIESLLIEDVRVSLQVDAAGVGNWQFVQPSTIDDERSDAPPTVLPVMLQEATITRLTVAYDSPSRPRPLDFNAPEIRLTRAPSDALQLVLTGGVNETPVSFNATAGNIDDLLQLADVDVEMSGHLGEVNFEGAASIDNLFKPARPTANLRLHGPNAQYLTGILQMQQVTSGALDLTATIAPDGERMRLQAFSASSRWVATSILWTAWKTSRQAFPPAGPMPARLPGSWATIL